MKKNTKILLFLIIALISMSVVIVGNYGKSNRTEADNLKVKKDHKASRYTKEIGFIYQGGKKGKLEFKNGDYFVEGLRLTLEDGKVIDKKIFANYIKDTKILKLKGNDYEDVYFYGAEGGMGRTSSLIDKHFLLNTKEFEIVSLSVSWDHQSTKIEGFKESENYLDKRFSKEREYLEQFRK